MWAETSVLATAMNADRVAVHGKALQYSVADANTAALTDGENGLKKLTGKKAGATKLTASLVDNDAIKAERTVTVLSDGMQETPRMRWMRSIRCCLCRCMQIQSIRHGGIIPEFPAFRCRATTQWKAYGA